MSNKFQKQKNKSINLYAIHIPIIVLLLALLVLGGMNISLWSSKSDSDGGLLGFVLGDDDDDDDDNDNSGSGNKNDDDDDDDNSGSGNKNDNDDDDDDDNDNSGSGNKNDNDDDDDDVDNSGTGSGIGTRTRIESNDDDEDKGEEIKIREISFDEEGNKIVRIYELDDDGDEKIRYKVYDFTGTKLSDFRLETKDGKEVELRIKEGDTELTRVRFDAEKEELIVKTGDDDNGGIENRLRIRVSGNEFSLTRSGVDAMSRFPLIVDAETGLISVLTPVGEVALNTMPDTIVEKALLSDDSLEVDSIDLDVAEDSTGNELEYKLTGTKLEALLGIFDVQIPSVLVFDAETGDFVKTEQTFINRILDLFSF